MSDFKKSIPTLLGFIGTASLICLSGLSAGITPALLGVVGGLSTELSGDMLKSFSPDKIKGWLQKTHPDDLNHSIKKLFVKSINDALANISVLYSETTISPEEKKAARQAIKQLQQQLPAVLMDINNINLEDETVKSFLYTDNNAEDATVNYLVSVFDRTPGISNSLKNFLSKHIYSQVQLCFGEGLKNPQNHDAWAAFQRMLSEDIRDTVRNIEKTQLEIKDEIRDIKTAGKGFNKTQWAEIRKLNELLSDKPKVELLLNSALEDSLKGIELRENEIIRQTTETNLTVKELKILLEKLKKQEKMRFFLVISLLMFMLVGVAAAGYKTIQAPFNATINIHGWKGENHHPLKDIGIISVTVDGKILKSEISKDGTAVFTDLPVKVKNQPIKIDLTDTEGMPYFLADSVIVLQKGKVASANVLLQGIEKLTGEVIDRNTGYGVEGAIVRVAETETTTDSFGKFEIKIPPARQEAEQQINVYKTGYQRYSINVQMVGGEPCIIVLEKL